MDARCILTLFLLNAVAYALAFGAGAASLAYTALNPEARTTKGNRSCPS